MKIKIKQQILNNTYLKFILIKVEYVIWQRQSESFTYQNCIYIIIKTEPTQFLLQNRNIMNNILFYL